MGYVVCSMWNVPSLGLSTLYFKFYILRFNFFYASVAQWIERLASDQKVVGSTPAGGTSALLRKANSKLKTKNVKKLDLGIPF